MLHPFGNDTVSPPAQWHPEPNFRGTCSVLSSCLLTMFLCVWTAVHLNLPEHKKEREQTLRKVGWLLLALVAPEVVAWNAFEQRRVVKKLTRDMRKLYRQQRGIEEPKKKTWYHSIATWWSTLRRAHWLRRSWHKTKVFFLCEAGDLPPPPTSEWPARKDEDAVEAFWTDVHSWYAVMGGFAFDTSSAARPFLPDSRERIVLTMDGLIALAKHWPHLLPRLSQGDIEDKSKSDGLAKLITCWQATWFCVQCICRLAQGLSISLLELNVFGHAICALLIYVLWWTKPKDIYEPTTIVGEVSHSIAAWMCNQSPTGTPMLFKSDCRQRLRRDRSIVKRFYPCEFHGGLDTISQCRWYSPGTKTVAYYPIRDLLKHGTVHIEGTHWSMQTGSRISWINLDSNYVAVDPFTANRLSLIRQLPQAHDPELWKDDYFLNHSVRYRNTDWCINLDFLDLDHFRLELLQYLGGITLACGMYGGLHATAWYAPCPSSVEQLLWRASSATVTSSGIGCMLALGNIKLVNIISLDAYDLLNRNFWLLWLTHGTVLLLWYLTFPIPLWYCFCRSFLVVESFINVAHLSARDLGLPTWSSYVPHIS